MTYSNFKKRVLDHLSNYKEKSAIQESGIYKYKDKYIYKSHILPIKGESKGSVVKKYNVLNCLKNMKFLIEEKHIHRFAHHLNSSQLVCYNFFRPYIEIEGSATRPNKDLIKMLGDCGLDIKPCNDVECQFEYEQGGDYEGEGTNFDFYLRSGETEVFFEIKYTEEGFGNCAADKRHKEKFEEIYKELIKSCPAINGSIKFDDNFRKNYQLFRNSIRVKDKNKYVVFIYDDNNNYCKNQLSKFCQNYITDEYKDNIKGITWQVLVKYLKSNHREEFCEKYINY